MSLQMSHVMPGNFKTVKIHLPVANLIRVQISQGGEELLHDFGCLNLIQVLVLNDIMEKLSTLAVSTWKISPYDLLNDKEADFVPLPDFKQPDDVRMILKVLYDD